MRVAAPLTFTVFSPGISGAESFVGVFAITVCEAPPFIITVTAEEAVIVGKTDCPLSVTALSPHASDMLSAVSAILNG